MMAATLFVILAVSANLQAHAQPAVPSETKVVEYKSPIKRVTLLLQKMKAELEKEADNESEMYDKMVCWCETSEKEKKKAIADADAKDAQLTSEIESRSARFGELSAEIANLKEQIAEDSQALKEAEAIREGGQESFRGEEADLVQAITNLRNAIEVLSKQGDNFVQLNAQTLASVRAVLRDVAIKHEMLVGVKADSEKRRAVQSIHTMLLSVSEERQSSASRQMMKQNRQVMSALNVDGSHVPDILPLKFAEQVLEQSAHSAAEAAPGAAFLQASSKQPIYSSYSSRSGTIVGILKQMLEDFEGNLKQSQEKEKNDAEGSAQMSEAKAAQIEAGKEKLDEMETEQAQNEKALSDAKEDLELTRKQRSADVEFLRNLKVTCQDLDKQFEERSKTRSQEILAVAETLKILTQEEPGEFKENEAGELVWVPDEEEATPVAFFQDSSSITAEAGAKIRRARAAQSLRTAAQEPMFETDDLLAAWRGHRGSMAVGAGPRAQLSTLAMTVQLDSFTKVKEAMDKMISELKAQTKEDVEFKAHCAKELNDNEKARYKKNEEKEDLENEMDRLTTLMNKLGEEIESNKQQIADTEVEIKKASQDREKQNQIFQTTVADQRATQEVLTKALQRLEQFYKKKAPTKEEGEATAEGPSFAQQTPPVQFNDYKKNSGASPVMSLIEQIIEDSKKVEDESTTDERKSQTDYEMFVKDSNALIAELTAAVTSKTKAIASAKLDLTEATSDQESASGELTTLVQIESDLHAECDWLLRNFEIRAKAFGQEIEAIQAAKGILSGAK